MLLLLALWLHKTHRNCTIIARSSTNTVDLYASVWPQTARINTWRENSSLATTSVRQCSTCYGRDGTIASRSINRENNIEAFVIFKKIQFALGSPNRWEFYSRAKKGEQEHVPHFLHKTSKPGGFWRFTLYSCKSKARKCTKKCAAIRPIVVVNGIQRLFSVRYLFGEANFA